MESNKSPLRSHSLELEILDLHLPCLQDFSKVKVVLTLNNYTQSLAYPFKTMTIPLVDDFSVLEISILQSNSILGGIEVPVTLFKNKKSQTFKLLPHQQSKKSSPGKADSNEITLGIKFWPQKASDEEYKEQIRKLELKVKETEEKVGNERRNQQEMQQNFEEITKNLSKMIKNQEDTINNLINDKEKMNDYLKKVENELKTRVFEDRLLKQVQPGRKKMHSFDLSNKEKLMSRQQLESFDKDYILKLEDQAKLLKTENESLKLALQSSQQKLDDLEFKLSEMSVSTSGEKSEKLSNEGIVLSLRGDMARMAGKYKTRISKLVESRNLLIQENKTLTSRIQELEKSASKTPERSKSPGFPLETSETRPNSYKLLGKFANNIKKIENSLNKSPRPSSEALHKYLELTPPHSSNSISTVPNNANNAFILKKAAEARPRHSKDAIDLLLEDQGASPVWFVKESEGVYSFGSKRVFIKLESGKLFIRIGAGFLTLEEFLKIYLPLELEKKNRDKGRDPEVKAKSPKLVTCFGVQRRSASVSKLPVKTSRD